MTEMTIGRLADEAGVNVETIRYYQRRGLLLEPDRPVNGQHRYSRAVVKRVRFIKRAQVLGQCDSGPREGSCPIIRALATDGCSVPAELPDPRCAAADCTASRPL